ncbi:MAG: META domain-containing protein [Gammaproteobacteria bacterium]
MKQLFIAAVLIVLQSGCSTSGQSVSLTRSQDPKAVLGKTWQWQETVTPAGKIAPANPERYTLLLSPGGWAQMRFDCNRGGGGYEIGEGQLSFGPMMSTRMACPGASLYTTYMKHLQEVRTFFVENGELYLELPIDGGTLHFRRQP